MNIVIVLGTMALTHFMENYYAIAFAVILSGIIQLAFIIFSAYRAGLRINLPKIFTKIRILQSSYD
jgi:peptidoglycan biosynthesis protein MviN/MurJ (putative lipid II flippase)